MSLRMASWVAVFFAVGASAATPAQRIASLTTRGGLYSNTIPSVTVTVDAAEVCWSGGVRDYDILAAGASTVGGNCAPGDLGFVIELQERTPAVWFEAMETCTAEGMRLPEVFEFQVACDLATGLGAAGWTDDNEWVSNVPDVETVPMGGSGSCIQVNRGGVGTPIGVPFRCVW